MQDLGRALVDIKAMRSQLARSTQFRGYGPATIALTAILACAAAVVQARWLARPAANPSAYIILWSGTGVISVGLIAAEVWFRARRVHCGLANEMINAAAEQLIPAGVAGGLLTLVLWRFAPASLWMLPGLWQIVLALGIFSACRSLPEPIKAVAFWYLATGLACLAFASGGHAFSPWAMGLPFVVGEGMAAGLIAICGGGDDETA